MSNDAMPFIPDGLIVFISGVPGVGKTTISYELLKNYNKFRVIQETDLIREILRGFNEYIEKSINNPDVYNMIREKLYIPDHMKIFNYDELKKVCLIMKKPIDLIVSRQQRKGISSIINGVHIVPEILNGIARNNNIIYVNLYINNKSSLRSRLANRDPNKYMPYIDTSFDANCSLHNNMLVLSQKQPNVFIDIDVTYLSIEQIVKDIINFITSNTS